MINSSDLDDVLKSVKERLAERKETLPLKDIATWDMRVRKLFYKTMVEVLKARERARAHILFQSCQLHWRAVLV